MVCSEVMDSPLKELAWADEAALDGVEASIVPCVLG